MNKIRKITVLFMVVIMTLILCSCGTKGSKVKDYEGFYTTTYTTSSGMTTYHEAMIIDKKGNVKYGSVSGYYTQTVFEGTMEIENDKGVFYCSDSWGYRKEWINEFPFTLTLLNDGEKLNGIFTGDLGARNFTKVSEEELKTFCEENEVFISIDELKESRNQ